MTLAYPGENEHKAYMDYVIEVQSNGGTPLPKEEWRKQKNASGAAPTMKAEGGGLKTALSEY